MKLEKQTGVNYLDFGALFGITATKEELKSGKISEKRLINNVSLTRIVEITWAALLHEDPGLTIDDAAMLVDARVKKQADLMLVLIAALTEAVIPEATDEGKEKNESRPESNTKPDKSS